MKIKREECLST